MGCLHLNDRAMVAELQETATEWAGLRAPSLIDFVVFAAQRWKEHQERSKRVKKTDKGTSR